MFTDLRRQMAAFETACKHNAPIKYVNVDFWRGKQSYAKGLPRDVLPPPDPNPANWTPRNEQYKAGWDWASKDLRMQALRQLSAFFTQDMTPKE